MHAEKRLRQKNGVILMNKMDQLLQLNIGMSPTRVEIELTEQCNLFCKFCYNSQEPVVSSEYKEIIERLEQQNVLEVILTGGEPMLHPQFKEILYLCRDMFSKSMIQTIGTLIDDDMADLIKETGVFGVNVSLHGSKFIHESLTCVEDSYEFALDAIKKLVKRNIRVASNFVLTSVNINELDDTIELMYSIGLRELTLTRFTPTGIGANNAYLSISSDELLNSLNCVKAKMQKYKDLKIILANSIPYCALPSELGSFCEYCHFGISRFYIDVNGSVLMCGMSRIAIGNILINDFVTMKESSDIFKNHVLGQDVPGKCKICSHFNICRGGCRAAALACSGEICGADPYSI